MSVERLGVTVIPGAGWRASDIRNVARAAEDAGFEAIFTTEVNNDALATAQLMGSATAHIRVGTWIANIYLRHSYTCAKGASLIADDTGGRFILGLGVSHQPVNDALAIDMSNAPADLDRYVLEVRDWLDGKGPTTHLPQQPAPAGVPIYIATLSLAAVERAAQIADGIMPTMWSPERVTHSAAGAGHGRAQAPHLPPWTSPWGCRHSSGMTWTPCATWHARTWACTPPSPTSSACGARAASAPRPTRWRKAPGRPP
jgi:alkanesulfonate monooxygenase SsuD/methylene tetrahydromethanopterin reductase-like flavin-dependent oxidoreductase (luciferase family)